MDAAPIDAPPLDGIPASCPVSATLVLSLHGCCSCAGCLLSTSAPTTTGRPALSRRPCTIPTAVANARSSGKYGEHLTKVHATISGRGSKCVLYSSSMKHMTNLWFSTRLMWSSVMSACVRMTDSARPRQQPEVDSCTPPRRARPCPRHCGAAAGTIEVAGSEPFVPILALVRYEAGEGTPWDALCSSSIKWRRAARLSVTLCMHWARKRRM